MKKTKAKNKKILIIFIAIALIMGISVIINATTFDNPVIIGFEDEMLYEKIKLELDSNGIKKYQLNKDDSTIGNLQIKLEEKDLKSITSLDLQGVTGSQIANLSGIEDFTNLEELNLSGNAITNMDTVPQLLNLVSLNMSGNDLNTNEDVLNTISSLTNLRTLNLANTKLNNLNALSNLNKLVNLILSGNQINDFSPIIGFVTINKLDISNNSSFVTLGPITSLQELKELNISYTGLTSLDGIDSFLQLEKLYASNITGLQKDKNRLDSLYSVDEDKIAYLSNLKVLDLSSSGITETKDSTGKVIQSANQAPIAFDKLAKLPSLEELYLENMGISSLNGIVNLKNLKILDLANNKIDSDELENLITTKDEVVQTEDVLKASKIELQDNEIIDISIFASYPGDIQYLDLSRNHIYNTQPLLKHSLSEKLYLKDQDIAFSIYDKAVNVDHYIILPEIFKSNKIEGSLVYSEDDYTLTGLTLNNEFTDPNNYNVRIGFDKTKKDIISIKINGGNAAGTTLKYVIGASASNSHNGYVTESFYFNDPNMYQTMFNEILNDPQGQEYMKYEKNSFIVAPQKIININRVIVDKMKLLYFDSKSIQDVTGLENCSKTTDLYLQGNNISDIQPLYGCTELVKLKLANNKDIGDDNSSIEKMTKITYLDLSNTGMTNIDSINNLINSLRSLKLYELNISQNFLQDITGMEKIISLGKLGIAYNQLDEQDLEIIKELTTLTTLDISGNQIADISALTNLSNLTHLYFDNNKIESIEPLRGKTFTELSFKENRIKDITPLSAHSSINKLYMDNNQIEDASILEDISISEEFSISGQKITRVLSSDGNDESSIDLPQIFKAVKTNGTKVYTSRDLMLTNCELDSTGDKVIVNTNDVITQAAQVKVYLGKANGTTLTITIPLIATVQYSVPSDTMINQDVTATVSFNRAATITNNDGKNTYTFTENGTFTFEYVDDYGFAGTVTATVENIDKEAPVITGVENEKKYNSSVTPKIRDNNSIGSVALTKNGIKINGYQSGQIIRDAGKYVLTAKDTAGNTTTVSFEIQQLSDIITSEEVTVIEKDGNKSIIKDINPNTTVSELKQKLSAEMDYKIVDKNGTNLSDNAKVATGCKIKMANDKTYTLIVKGDCDGDGAALIQDIFKINKHRKAPDSNILKDEYLIAADLDGDGDADLIDIFAINKIRPR